MKAAVYHGRGDVRVEDVPEPAPPGDGEVTIRVSRCGVCGTDAHEYADGPAFVPLTKRHPASGHLGPMILGHEFIGTVVLAGDASGPIVPGMRVAAGAGRWCGVCAPCLRGRTNLCENYYTYGLQADGGLAEYVTVPAQMCVPIPDSCDDANAALAQPMSIAMHALRRGGAEPGEPVVLFGAGGIGSLLTAAAVARGMPVHVLDVAPERLENALALGAASASMPDAAGLAAVRALGRTGAPLVIESSGSPAALGNALSVTGTGGRVVMLGLPHRSAELDVRAAVVAEIDLISSSAHACLTDMPMAVKALTARPIDRLIVDRVVPLDRVATDGLAPLSRGELRGKPVISMEDL
jgi:(R,R)-butanediol dehydrogenase/meso-butanediol dehydrogenase/diacetyl reductase